MAANGLIGINSSDCFVACSARALSLIGPPSPRSVGTTHSTKGLFRRLNWATSPRSGWRCAQLRAGPASGTLAGRAEVRVPPVTESHIDAARPQAERWTHTPRTMSRISAPALRTWARRWMRQAHALDSPQPLAPPGGVGAHGQHCQVREACVCQGCAVSAAQAVEVTTPQAAGHHEQMALVAHAPNTDTQAKGASPQDPERRGHATRQYTVKVSLLTSEAPHPEHPAPVAHVGTRRVQKAMGRQRRRMASGDAQKVWFPELIAMVRQAGDAAMSMDTLLRLRDRLNTILQNDPPHAADPAGHDVVSALPGAASCRTSQCVRAGHHLGLRAVYPCDGLRGPGARKTVEPLPETASAGSGWPAGGRGSRAAPAPPCHEASTSGVRQRVLP